MKTNFETSSLALFAGSALVLTLCLSACSTSAGSSPAVVSSTSSSSSTTTTPAADAPLPLDAYMSSITGLSGSYADVQEQNFQLALKREELTSTCMKGQGFTYTPDAVKNTLTSGQVGPEDSDLDSPSWVTKYGYGDVYQPAGATGAIEQTATEQGGAKKSGAAANASPNSQYRASLTVSEQKAYDQALYGEGGSDLTLTIANDWQRLGCSGASLHAVPSQNVIMGTTQGQAVETAVNNFYDSYSTWPGIAAAEKAWSSCMDQSGNGGYATQSAPAAQFAEQNTALWAGFAPGSAPSTADLDALANKERTVALADLNCRMSTEYASTIRAITVSQENQFLADNKVVLDALAASTGQSK